MGSFKQLFQQTQGISPIQSHTPSLDSKTTTMLFKSVLLATFASLALAAPGGGGEYDQGDYNWGKDKCYMKKYTVYETSTAYKDNVYYKTEYKTYPYYETKTYYKRRRSIQ